MPDLKAAGAICYVPDVPKTLFLLLRSAKHGEWGPPKGHAQEHETEVETAVRELYEEAGISHPGFAPGFRECISYEVEKKGQRRSKQVVYFLCRISPDDVHISHEHTDAHFATLDEIAVLIRHDNLKNVFRKAQEHLQNAAAS